MTGVKRRPCRTSINGLFIKSLSVREAKELSQKHTTLANEGLQSEEVSEQLILELFALACDENGESFDEFSCLDSIEQLSLEEFNAFANAIKEALVPGEAAVRSVNTDWTQQVRTLLLANGSPLETVDNLDLDDMRHLYAALRLGLWGPFGEYKRAYYSLAKQNEIAEILRATALGKKFKATPFARYHELFPTIEEAESLGAGSIQRFQSKKQQMAAKAVLALGGDVPAWIANALS